LKIETLVNLTGGELLNSPYISEVTSFTDDEGKVLRGGCFFVYENSDVKTAVKNGAYAIISEKYEDIIDNEIAWIKVESLEKAVIDIFKYEHLKEKVFICDEITENIIEKMNLNPNVVILKNYKDLLNALNLQNKILITSNKLYEELFANVEVLLPTDINLEKLSLFKSKFEGNEINLPYVYKDNFSRALKFFRDHSLKYTIEFNLDRFKPVFVDYKLRSVEFGESEKVVITGVKNDRFFVKELNYFIENTKHAKSIVVNEYNVDLLKGSFNFALAVDIDVEFNEKEEHEGLL